MSSTQPGRGLGVKDVEWVKPPPPEDLRRAALRLVAWAIEADAVPEDIRNVLEAIGYLPHEVQPPQKGA